MDYTLYDKSRCVECMKYTPSSCSKCGQGICPFPSSCDQKHIDTCPKRVRRNVGRPAKMSGVLVAIKEPCNLCEELAYLIDGLCNGCHWNNTDKQSGYIK
jgi:hypothetical protein